MYVLLHSADLCHSPLQPPPMSELLIDWRDSGKISEEAFNKVARENAIRLLRLE